VMDAGPWERRSSALRDTSRSSSIWIIRRKEGGRVVQLLVVDVDVDVDVEGVDWDKH